MPTENFRSQNLNLPFITPSQAMKHVTVNEAVRALDALVQLSVIARDIADAPPSPADGARYLIPNAAIGDWAGHDNEIAAWQDGAWAYFAPQPGWRVWCEAESALLVYTLGAWEIIAGDGAHQNLTGVGIGTVSDTTNRLAVVSPSALFTHAGDDQRLILNKAASGDTGSLLYQTGYSGRAEMGLTGDDDFHIKVSPDGAAYTEALIVDKDDGAISCPQGVVMIERTGLNPAIVASRASGTSAALGTGLNAAYFMFDDAGRFDIKSQTSANILNGGFAGGSVPRFTVLATGEVGIGTIAPTCALEVTGDAKLSGGLNASGLPASASGLSAGDFYVGAGGAVHVVTA